MKIANNNIFSLVAAKSYFRPFFLAYFFRAFTGALRNELGCITDIIGHTTVIIGHWILIGIQQCHFIIIFYEYYCQKEKVRYLFGIVMAMKLSFGAQNIAATLVRSCYVTLSY